MSEQRSTLQAGIVARVDCDAAAGGLRVCNYGTEPIHYEIGETSNPPSDPVVGASRYVVPAGYMATHRFSGGRPQVALVCAAVADYTVATDPPHEPAWADARNTSDERGHDA
jgi:hypothetical protein